jgi:hypothetical protein
MAIGWICIEAGNPGVWSEFGGMIDEPIVLDPGSVGMDELNSEVKSKLLLSDSIVINVQALQSAVANCATKDDLKNIDLSLYATKEELNNIDMSEKQDKVDNSLSTNDKSIVGAINELFQDVDSGKQLIADAIDDSSIDKNSTFGAMSEAIEDIQADRTALQLEATTNKSNLATVLTDEGIEVDDNDDMTSLINKVDEAFDNKNRSIQYKEITTAHFNTGLLFGVKAENNSLVLSGTTEGYRISPEFNAPNHSSNNINWDGDGKIYFLKDSTTHVINSSFSFPSVSTKYSFESAPFTTTGSYVMDSELGIKAFTCTKATSYSVGKRLIPTNVGSGFSIFFRIKTTSTTNHHIFLNENGYSNRGVTIRGGSVAYQHATGGVYKYVVSNITINDGKWHTVLVTFNSSVCRIIIDGVQQVSSSYTGLSYGTNDTFYCTDGDSYSYFVVCSTILPDDFGLPCLYIEQTKNNAINSSIDLTKPLKMKQVLNQNQSISNVNITFTVPSIIYPN